MKYSNTTIRELTARYSRILKKCALLNAVILLGVAFATPAMAATYSDQSGNTGGALYVNDAQSIEAGSSFTNNSAHAGGGIYIGATGDLTLEDGITFDNNRAEAQSVNSPADSGGAIYLIDGAKLTAGNSITFTNNKAVGEQYDYGDAVTGNKGGAIFAEGADVAFGDKAKFEGNEARQSGGAIYNWSNKKDVTLSLGAGSEFHNNTAKEDNGGAIVNFDGSVELAEGAKFSNNTAGKNGGAIANQNYESIADMTIGSGATFTTNKANQGGAIYNTGDMTIASGSTYKKNTAQDGGAIYNTGSMTITDALFGGDTTEVGNKASNYGGAILARCLNDGCTAKTTINSSTFKNNTASLGGALFGWTNSDTVISGSTFDSNTAQFGGAIYTATTMKNIAINDTVFSNNSAESVGAVGIFASGSLNNVTFENNKATNASDDGAGALFLGSVSQTKINNSTFAYNTSAAVGGAIAMRATNLGNNVNADLDVLNSRFTGNKAATKGGAIFSTFYSSDKYVDSVYISESTFDQNEAAQGAAIYNEGVPDKGGNLAVMKIENSTFDGNIASSAGGAIYNAGDGTIHFEGTNTFTNNTANGVKNDIHNEGTLNVAGNLTLDGGITGTGDVVFDAGSSLTATLNTTTILANSVTTNGSNLNLLVANGTADGAYDFVTADSLDQVFKLGDNTLYDLTMGDNGKISVVKKSTDEAAGALTSAGAGTNDAAAIVAITNVETTGNAQADAVLNQITTAAQTGDVETAAGIVKQINPTEAPVLQSVSTNNAVIGAVTNRLAIVGATASAGAQGRSGGDVVVSKLSPWVQGLYNKTHNSQGIGFDAYSQGFAFGVDTDLNDDWTVGVGYAYTATDIKNSLRKTQVYGDNYFVYGQYKPSNWYVNGVINYGHSNYKDIGALTNHYDVDTYGAQVMTGYQWDILNNYAGVRYTYIDTDKYNNGLTEVDTKSSQIATAVIGTKVSKDFTPKQGVTLTPEFRLAATYDFKSDGSSATVGIVGSSASYTVEGERLHRAAVETGIGLTAKIKNLELSANYDASLRSENNTQAVNLKAIYHF